MKIISLITHPHDVPNPFKTFILEHNLWNVNLYIFLLLNPSTFWPCIDSNTIDMFKAKKGSKNIIKTVHVTWVVQPSILWSLSKNVIKLHLKKAA